MSSDDDTQGTPKPTSQKHHTLSTTSKSSNNTSAKVKRRTKPTSIPQSLAILSKAMAVYSTPKEDYLIKIVQLLEEMLEDGHISEERMVSAIAYFGENHDKGKMFSVVQKIEHKVSLLNTYLG
jgi:hypothetical protein